jgi:hypothetical protein
MGCHVLRCGTPSPTFPHESEARDGLLIGGQQRLTTLQILLHAVQLVTQEHGDEDDAETLMELVANSARRFRGTPKRFKLWPSRIGRPAYQQSTSCRY